MSQPLERNLALELVRVTEAAAMAAARTMGLGDKDLTDQAAVDAMRKMLGEVDMDGVVVIGEGEKDEAPMLYIGEAIGNGMPPQVDVAVDPVDGTTATSRGLPNAISVVALAERGSMDVPSEVVYMDKIAVGPEAKGRIDIRASVKQNLTAIAQAKGANLRDLTVVVLDRPRHARLIDDIRSVGARVRLITDGDVAGAMTPALGGRAAGADALMGIGGTPEAVLAAAALKCLGGEIQCRLWPRDDAERQRAIDAGLNLNRVYTTDDLVSGEDVFFACTGVTDGRLLEGVEFYAHGATTHSLVMRSYSGTIRWIKAEHDFRRLGKLDSRYI